jgi:GntR family transcriptional regulator
VQAKLLSRTVERATAEDIEHLKVPEKSEVLRILRLRLIDNEPFAIEEAHLPMALCAGLQSRDMENASLHEALRAIGLIPVRARYSISNASPQASELALLEIDTTRPVLCTRWISFLSDGTPIESVRSVQRNESYEFDVAIDH